MKKLLIILGIIIIILIALLFLSHKKESQETIILNTTEPIIGCYVAHLLKDIYTLRIDSQKGETFSGELSYNNYQKDSSSGLYSGIYKDGILLGEYSFDSEGMHSTRQVIFKKENNNFVEGFGDYDKSGENFIDVNSVTYDPNTTFISTSDCPI